LTKTPASFTRVDGSSEFRPKHSTVFSAEHLLAAEDRLLKRADAITAPTVDIEVVDTTTNQPVKGHRLSPEQAQAIAKVAVSGRQARPARRPGGCGQDHRDARPEDGVDPAARQGNSVVGLAPSAVAAQVLAEDLGIGCENTAKWLYEHDRGRAQFRQGQLVIIDEATLAGTLTLDRLTALAPRPARRCCWSVTGHSSSRSTQAGRSACWPPPVRHPGARRGPPLHPRVGEDSPASTFATGESTSSDTYIATGE
jgi:hypothetical protein